MFLEIIFADKSLVAPVTLMVRGAVGKGVFPKTAKLREPGDNFI